MRKILLLFVLIGHLQVLAGNTDSLPPSDTMAVFHWDVNDSIRSIPFYDAYCSWDTFDIHNMWYDLTNWKDTVTLVLNYDTDCDYVHPHSGYVCSDFGYRRSGYHYGIDIKLETGESVLAAFEGLVRIAHRSRSYGNVVVIRHTNGLETLYAHLSKLLVIPNDWVEAGDIIGLGGNTGRSYGSHLHFECRYLDEPLNPRDIIDFENCTLKSDTLVLDKSDFKHLAEVRAVKWHRVRSGDTLSHIARRYGTSIGTLCKLNKMRRTEILHIGRRLRVN